MISNTQRTLAEIRKRGFLAEVVEKWVQAPGSKGKGFRRDLFNGIDVVAVGDGKIVGIQSCSATDQAKRVRKLMGDFGPPPADLDAAGLAKRDKTEIAVLRAMLAWTSAGGILWVWGWRKKGARWVINEREIRARELHAALVVREQQAQFFLPPAEPQATIEQAAEASGVPF